MSTKNMKPRGLTLAEAAAQAQADALFRKKHKVAPEQIALTAKSISAAGDGAGVAIETSAAETLRRAFVMTLLAKLETVQAELEPMEVVYRDTINTILGLREAQRILLAMIEASGPDEPAPAKPAPKKKGSK